MIIKANKQIGFIYKNNESIDKILKDGDVVFERGFLRERTTTTLPITFGGVGKDLKDYKVYGNTYQNSTTGKNLRYIKDETAAGVSLTYDNKSGKISIKGTATRTDGIKLSDGGEVNIPAGTYTLSVSEPLPVLINSVVSLSSSTNVAFRIPTGNTSVTVNVPSNGVLAGLYFAVTNGTTYNFDFYLQLEEGSVATEFEPYTGGQPSPNPDYPQEIISCGDRTKNLLPTNVSDWEQGAIGATTGENVESTVRIRTKKYYEIENGKDYYISLENNNYRFLNIILYDSNKSYLGQYYSIDSSINGAINLKINIPSSTISNVKYYRVVLRKSNNSATITPEEISTIKPMIALGDTKLDFEPYGYKIPVNVNNVITNIYLDEPLRKIDEYSDYINFINSKVVRQLGEVVLDGSEDWTTIRAYGRNYYAVAISNLLISNSGSNDALLYNNYYIGYKSDELVGNNTKDYGICRRNNNSQVLFRDKDQSILSDLTTWLSTHNSIMCYPLATPTEEDIELPNIPTVDGNNTLNIETEITPSQVYIKYKSNT